MKPTIKIILDTRRARNNSEKYPVKLRVTLVKEQKYYLVGLNLTKEEYNFTQNPDNIPKNTNASNKRQFKEWRLKCDSIAVKADKICDQIPDFTFSLFESKYFKNKQSGKDVYQFYSDVIARLTENAKIGTASNYRSSMNSLKLFSPKLSFRDITTEFLMSYEKWLLLGGKSISTVGIYLRPLRAIVNEAISVGIISRETHYPFGKRNYQIPAANNIKKALTKEEIGRLFKYECIPGTWHERARDFFILSYLCNGINIKDLALLKYKNLHGEYIIFNRAKTQHTNRASKTPISIFISPEVNSIISRWKSQLSGPEDYLFPILTSGISPEREFKLIKQFTKMINEYIKQIALAVGIKKPVTTYYARHSFATILKRSGASTEFIGESLGHTSTKTTANYLDSFENDAKKEWSKVLTNFERK